MSTENVPLDLIDDNPFNPREHYPRNAIEELAHSIEEVGMIHIPLARQIDGRYQIAEGHLRKRAVLKLRKKNPKKYGTITIDVRDIPDQDMALIALEENLRRQDITPIETARGVDKMLTSFTDMKEKDLAQRMNMSQGNISNMRRVLRLPGIILEKVEDGRINFTMGRELLIFEELEASNTRRFGGASDTVRDAEWLMKDAIQHITTGNSRSYGEPATVDGMKKAIYRTCEDNFLRLEKSGNSWNSAGDPLFDSREIGCLKCLHSIKANVTKSTVSHYCTNAVCWNQHQDSHKAIAAAQAMAKMQQDISDRIASAESERQETGDISQEIIDLGTDRIEEVLTDAEAGVLLSSQEDDEDDDGDDLEVEAQESVPGGQSTFESREDVCATCVNQGKCGHVKLHVVDTKEGSRFTCEDRVTKADLQALHERVQADMPADFKEKMGPLAGTRADMLDLRELRLGFYGDELKGGYSLLDGRVNLPGSYQTAELLTIIDDPDECLQRCTDGFHFAYDSHHNDGAVHFVCSKPKCLSRKKGTWTRAKNETGQARKRAEANAIKVAVKETTGLDRSRILLLVHSHLAGTHTKGGYSGDQHRWFYEHLHLGKMPEYYYGNEKPANTPTAIVMKKLEEIPDEEVAQLIVEFCLQSLTFDGDVKDYRILTEPDLKRMGIDVEVKPPKSQRPKKQAEEEKVEKRSVETLAISPGSAESSAEEETVVAAQEN